MIVIVGKFPDPLVLKPLKFTELAVAVQLNVVAVKLLVQVTKVEVAPEQMACDRFVLVTTGVGEIVTVKFDDVPRHPLKVGVTVMVPVMAVVPLLTGAVHDDN